MILETPALRAGSPFFGFAIILPHGHLVRCCSRNGVKEVNHEQVQETYTNNLALSISYSLGSEISLSGLTGADIR